VSRVNLLYADDAHFNNPFYGGGYSWGTAPGTFVLMYEPAWDPFAQVWAKYPSWGLRPGDVIEAVHIQEIIDAVDYLIDYGVWTSIPICTRKRTPGQFMGRPCGTTHGTSYDSSGPTTVETESLVGCLMCCADDADCSSWLWALGGYERYRTDGGEWVYTACYPGPPPLQWGRGCVATEINIHTGIVDLKTTASMGPWLCSHGNSASASAKRTRKKLQWGRGCVATEIIVRRVGHGKIFWRFNGAVAV